MAFEDLAKHMAARDGRTNKLAGTVNPDQIVAEAMKADRRTNRIMDLVLGPLLLVGGIGLGLLVYSVKTSGGRVASLHPTVIMIGVFAFGAISVGLMKTIRGITRRSIGISAPHEVLKALGETDDRAS